MAPLPPRDPLALPHHVSDEDIPRPVGSVRNTATEPGVWPGTGTMTSEPSPYRSWLTGNPRCSRGSNAYGS